MIWIGPAPDVRQDNVVFAFVFGVEVQFAPKWVFNKVEMGALNTNMVSFSFP